MQEFMRVFGAALNIRHGCICLSQCASQYTGKFNPHISCAPSMATRYESSRCNQCGGFRQKIKTKNQQEITTMVSRRNRNEYYVVVPKNDTLFIIATTSSILNQCS